MTAPIAVFGYFLFVVIFVLLCCFLLASYSFFASYFLCIVASLLPWSYVRSGRWVLGPLSYGITGMLGVVRCRGCFLCFLLFYYFFHAFIRRVGYG